MLHKIKVLQMIFKDDIRLLKNFGFCFAFQNYVQKVILGGNKTRLGRRMNKKIADNIVRRIETEYQPLIEEYQSSEFSQNQLIDEHAPIWIFWWQGMHTAPPIVKICFQSVKKNKGKHSILLITEKNYKDYTDIPDYIIQKLNEGKITLTHFSDILRLELLHKHGGIWMDATLWMTDSFPDDMYKYSLYSVKHQKYADYHICRGQWSGFFLAAIPNNPFIGFSKELLFEYWKKEDSLIYYLLIDAAFCIAYDNFPWAAAMIDKIPTNNTAVFEIQNHMNEIYSEQKLLNWKKQTFIHKLSYKIPFKSGTKGKETYWHYMNQLYTDCK